VWLLDANLDIRIAALLAEFGLMARTSESLGWKQLSSGELVAAAVANGFTCLLTRDQLFTESAARTLKQHPEFAIVVIRIPQGKWPAYGEAFRRAWAVSPILPTPGKAASWPPN